jgi:hypothetical protein
LAKAGFSDPLLRTDHEHIGAWGNWWLLLHELWICNPTVDTFAVFQDDVIAVKNLRQYVEQSFPRIVDSGCSYLNLYTSGSNQKVAPPPKGWFQSNQMGRGAVALLFPREVVRMLLSSTALIDKPRQAKHPTDNVDGAISNALRPLGVFEWCHNPSLAQHVGIDSTLLGKVPNEVYKAPSFPGEKWDALISIHDPKLPSFVPTGDLNEDNSRLRYSENAELAEKFLGVEVSDQENKRS